MKKIALLIALVTGSFVLAPAQAEARDSHRHDSRRVSHSCRSCGHSVYQDRCYTGRDRRGHPMYSWRTASHRCQPSYRGRSYGSHRSSYHRGAHISVPGFHLHLGR